MKEMKLRTRKIKFVVRDRKLTAVFCHLQKKCEMNEICEKFSAIKMGDMKEIESCAKLISSAIMESIPDYAKAEWEIAGIPSFMPNSAQCIGKNVSKLLKKKYIELTMKKWKNPVYYLDLKPSDRIKELRKLLYSDVNFSGKKIILIDDAISSSSVLKANSEVLIDNGARDIRAFAFVKFLEEKKAEKEASLLNYKMGGVKYMVKIARNKNNPVLSRMVSATENLSPMELQYLIKNMPKKKREEFIYRLREYKKIK